MRNIFRMFKPPYSREKRDEINHLTEELIQIGQKDDYLSEHPGGHFNGQCRHRRAREIGTLLNEIGGYELMEMIYERVKKKLGRNLADHLEFAWSNIGEWMS